jgi:restriction endonuclease
MIDNRTPITFDRCSLCRTEYIRLKSPSLSLDYIRSMSVDGFRDLVIRVLKENGYDVFESDKENPEKNDSFILESHKAETRRWHVESWSLFKCVNRKKPLDLEDVERFSELVLSDNAERGYVIATGGFTEDAIELAKSKLVELIDGKEFLNLVRKMSTSRPYCTECLKISASIRTSLKKLRMTIESLNRLEKESSGKWTAPLHLDLMFGEMARKIQSLFKTISKIEKKRLEAKLLANIKNVGSGIAKIEGDFKSFEKIIREFSKREK